MYLLSCTSSSIHRIFLQLNIYLWAPMAYKACKFGRDCFILKGGLLEEQSTLFTVYCIRNVVAHGDAREGKWRGNWRIEWVASTLTWPRHVVYPALLTLTRTPRLPAVDWTDSPADLHGLVRLGERRNLVSARVPSGSARALPLVSLKNWLCMTILTMTELMILPLARLLYLLHILTEVCG